MGHYVRVADQSATPRHGRVSVRRGPKVEWQKSLPLLQVEVTISKGIG